MIKVVSLKICPFVQRVIATLEARNIAYDVEYISLKNPPHWFLEVSPNAQVPLLITESGTTLFESDAIVEYIDEQYGVLEKDIPPEQRAIDRAWAYQASKHYLVQCAAMRSDDQETLKQRSEKLSKAFARIEVILDENSFYRGNSISNVDIAWLPILHRAKIIQQHTGYDFLSHYPKVKQWQTKLMQTKMPEQSVSADFEETFSSFYLSDKTFLGRCKNCTANSCSVDCCECA